MESVMGREQVEESKQSIVAFVDILGTKKLVEENGDDAEIVSKIRSVIEHSVNTAKKSYVSMRLSLNIKIYTFSDNIAFCVECPNNTSISTCFIYVASIVNNLYWNIMTKCGLMLRGAMTYGKVFADNNFLFGEALVNAHELESSVAIYPRIIIDKIFADIIESDKFNQRIIRDTDGQYILRNFYSAKDIFDRDVFYIDDILERVTACIELTKRELNRIGIEPKIFSKYYWLFDKLRRHICDDFAVELEKFVWLDDEEYMKNQCYLFLEEINNMSKKFN
jgi:hypothetical protein